MDKYERLRLTRHLKDVLRKYEEALKAMEPGTDTHEMVLAEQHEAQQTLARLEQEH